MTTSEPNEHAPIPLEAPGADHDETKTLEVRPEAPAPDPPPIVVERPTATAEETLEERDMLVDAPAPVAAPTPPRAEPETVYVPLAVSIGDGFKFGCGFFLALVIAMLIGFVLLAVLFVLSSLIGLNLPLSR